jgi:uncharacterized protein YceH (UPF0502 family)
MDDLTDVDVRVLGSLIEKEITTPDYYPLTLNALVTACNQVSNRDPVVQYDDDTVTASIERLRKKNLVHQIKRSDSRVVKFRHVLAEEMSFDPRQLAVMCVLMLRGPQTVGEIRTRTSRLHDFTSLEDVEAAIASLMGRQPVPPVVRLARRPGQKELRYAQTLAGEISAESVDDAPAPAPERHDRVEALEQVVAELRREMHDLRSRVEHVLRQFE